MFYFNELRQAMKNDINIELERGSVDCIRLAEMIGALGKKFFNYDNLTIKRLGDIYYADSGYCSINGIKITII